MRADDQQWLAVADAFNAAAIGETSWLEGLAGLAALTGSRCGELIGLGSDSAVPFNWVTDLGPDWVEEFVAVGGGDPEINPFVRMGRDAAELEVRVSGEFITPQDRRTLPFLAEHAVRYDLHHACLTPLVKQPEHVIGLAVVRSRREGDIDAQGRRIFATLAPHARAAVRTQLALELRGTAIVAGALEALSLAVFVCDVRGLVRAMTPAAETLVSEGAVLRMQGGRLRAGTCEQTRALEQAIGCVARGLERPGEPLARSLLLGDARKTPLALEIVPLPRRAYAFGFEPRALILVRGRQRSASALTTLLRAAYGLTSAEADVAVRLGEGGTPEAIADARASSLATVRAQMRALYAKLDVHNLNELIARLRQLS